MKDAGVIVYKDDDGVTHSIDMTYMNPFAIIQDPAVRAVESLVRGEGIGEASKKFITQFLKPYVSEQILTGAILDVFQNTDEYQRPITLAGDDDKWTRKGMHIAERAFSPRSLMSADAAYDSFLSKESTANFFDSGIGHLLKSVIPLRSHPQDFNAGLGRYLYNHSKEYGANNMIFNTKMAQIDVLRDGEVTDAYDRWVRNKMYYNNDLKQTLRGFEKLGVPRSEINSIAKSRSISKRRLKNIQLGVMDTPVLTKPLSEKLSETFNGRRRIDLIDNHREEKHPRAIIHLDK